MRQRKLSKKAVIATSISAAVIIIIGLSLYFFLNWRPLEENSKAQPQSSSSEKEVWDENFKDYLFCGIDETGSLTDVIMVVSVNNKTGNINILQIPRDTYIDLDIPTHKYNALYGHHDENVSGMEALKTQVEKDFGLTISNYGAVTTSGFRTLVDSVGGVDIDVPIDMNYDDETQDLHIHLSRGYQHLDGEKAEQFVRYRKGWSEGDVGRLSAQQLFLAAFSDKIKSMSTAEISTNLLSKIKQPDFKTDMSVAQIITLFSSSKEVSLENTQVFTMPGEYFTSDEGLSVYSCHKEELLKILNSYFVPESVTLNESDISIKEVSSKEKTNSSESASQSNNFENILH